MFENGAYSYKSYASILFMLSSEALGNLLITSPVTGNVCQGGTPCTVSWIDDGRTPTIAEWGETEFALCVGTSVSQDVLQIISRAVDVSSANSVEFILNPTIGPNSTAYFIRAKSNTAQSDSFTAFSVRFELDNMNGNVPPLSSALFGSATAQNNSPSSSPPPPVSSNPPPKTPLSSSPSTQTIADQPSSPGGTDSSSTNVSGTKGPNIPSQSASPAVHTVNIAVVASAVLGAILGLLITLALIFFTRKRWRRKQSQSINLEKTTPSIDVTPQPMMQNEDQNVNRIVITDKAADRPSAVHLYYAPQTPTLDRTATSSSNLIGENTPISTDDTPATPIQADQEEDMENDTPVVVQHRDSGHIVELPPAYGDSGRVGAHHSEP